MQGRDGRIDTREELLYLLTMGAELEHGLSCLYLFTAFSVKTDPTEGGFSAEQSPMLKHWKRTLSSVAIDEMLHLAQVNNLITALGGAPAFTHPSFPMPADEYPFGLALTLEPFSYGQACRLVAFELPEALPGEMRDTYEHLRAALPEGLPGEQAATRGSGIEPFPIDFRTIGEFYRKIERALKVLPEERLFIGPRESQVRGAFLDMETGLREVSDRASALAAIDMIVEQGEGARVGTENSHFTRFDVMRRDYAAALEAARAAGTEFAPARPVVPNPVTRARRSSAAALITDPATHAVAELFNLTYTTLLHVLMQLFDRDDASGGEQKILGATALGLMTSAIRPLGEGLTKMPFGTARPGMTAGPSFALSRDVQELPHRRAAWMVIDELLDEVSSAARELAFQDGMPDEIAAARDGIARIAEAFPRDYS
ncbi:MAG: ferritin-like domain-containing protein [Candidatus Limnocylindria bacterium]|nr:ferritin-like domain-containing protein [Candidatus Limnocylindria bacterium]